MNNDLVWIQNNYGDTMMKICKLHFSMILELPGMMPRILKHNFQMNRGLIKDILLQGNEEDFKRFIYYKVKDVPNIENKNFKSPYQLMKEAGYTLYKCETDEEIKYFQKYYSKGEELSTCHIDNIKRTDIFFGVKNNVSEIKRSSTPNRDDEYGTSVISIQFNDGDVNDVSIKNRYNHTVWSPDATFDNKLDNIINGLTDSFENEFGYQINNSKDLNNFKLEDYILGPDNKYYKCNVSLNNISYCADNVVIKDNKVTTYDSKRYVLIENYLVDKYENTIKDLSGNDKTFDKKFKNIKVRIKQGKKEIRLTEYDSDIISKIYTNENSEVVELDLPNLKVIGSDFFQYNRKLKRLKLKNVEEIGRNFLTNNQALKDINIPLVKKISSSFITKMKKLKKLIYQN